jgi:hypothetical protein
MVKRISHVLTDIWETETRERIILKVRLEKQVMRNRLD